MSDVAYITGVAGILGRACAKQLSASRWYVAGGGRSLPREAVQGLSFFSQLDVRKESSVSIAFGLTQNQVGKPVRLLIHAAGVTRDALVARQDVDDWDAVEAVHLRGAWLCARQVWPGMIQLGGGHIIFVASHAAHLGAGGQGAYAAAKAGLIGLSQSLAEEGAVSNIRVNTICPGLLHSPMTEALDADQREALLKGNLLNRFNQTGEVASFVTWLASTEQVSGQVFYLDSRRIPWA